MIITDNMTTEEKEDENTKNHLVPDRSVNKDQNNQEEFRNVEDQF